MQFRINRSYFAACIVLITGISVASAGVLCAQETSAPNSFLEFVQSQAAELRSGNVASTSLADWQEQRSQLREQLQNAWGGFPEIHAAPEVRVLDTLDRDGYRVEKIVFQTLPDIWMTANAYVPDGPGKHAAVLCVHGHWKGAKQDPHVQARCIGLAKLGFFVLAVDALGAGERALGKGLGEYHGEMVAATLWPIGRPLSGLQVYENMRAVDYMVSRAEVDADRVGVTGASGGGNQTMYAGAWDERLKAVVPVCSVGNYQAYLGAACCMCEVVPGALQFTEEAAVLSLVAPRALMVINATKDSFQFSVGEAQKSVAGARSVFQLYQRDGSLRHTTFESPHDYSQPMREAMYGWMALHLRGEGDGSPIAEPAMTTEDPAILRCYPGETRPDDWITIPKFAAEQARTILRDRLQPATVAEWRALSEKRRRILDEVVLGNTSPLNVAVISSKLLDGIRTSMFSSEPGIELQLVESIAAKKPEDSLKANIFADEDSVTVVYLKMDKQDDFAASLKDRAVSDGLRFVTVDLRATGKNSFPTDGVGRAIDHNSAEWSLWLGRPLLGQWVQDVRAAITILSATKNGRTIKVIGKGPAGLVAICAAAVDDRIDHVITVGTLSSFVTEVPYENQRLGTLANGILRDVGDVADLASLIAPRKVILTNSVAANGRQLTDAELIQTFQPTANIYKLLNAAHNFRVDVEPVAADRLPEILRGEGISR